MDTISTHSRYGGMWIDRSGWDAELAARQARGQVSDRDAARLREFVESGYVILRQAADIEAIDRFQQAIAAGFENGNSDLRYQRHGSPATYRMDGPVDRLGCRVVDSYVALPQALDLFTSPALIGFLRLILNADPLLFQSLSFDQGSQQGLHQDTAYVVVDRPMELAACWIALEDVRPGSGELMYVPGSHRFADFDFGWGHKHFPNRPGDGPLHDTWSRWIVEEAATRGLVTETFLARKGDILIWHADLAHGGSPVRDPTLTRQSLVGHFCPATASPAYFKAGRRATTKRYGALHYASEHYELSAETPAQPGFMRSLVQKVKSTLPF